MRSLFDPIPKTDLKLLEAFSKREWQLIPILETTTKTTKKLVVVSNKPFKGYATAWPAYANKFGELAESIPKTLQKSSLVKVRPQVALMLHRAQQILNSNPDTARFQLVLVDGYRRIDVQRKLFVAYKNFLAKMHPDIDEHELNDRAQQMVSIAPENLETVKKCPPPHSTGGAVDVVLMEKSDKINMSNMINFGARFDEMMHPKYKDERSFMEFYEGTADNEEVKKNRRVLFNVMTRVGFTNYPYEFWHYDFGNQFHALCTGSKNAKYGFAGSMA